MLQYLSPNTLGPKNTPADRAFAAHQPAADQMLLKEAAKEQVKGRRTVTGKGNWRPKGGSGKQAG